MRILLIGLVVLCTMANTAFAQIPEIPLFGNKIDSTFVPESAILAAVVRPSEFADKEKFDLFPREIVTAWGIKEFGFDPMRVEQATLVMETPNGPPSYGVALRFKDLQGVSDKVAREREQKQVDGYTLYSAGRNGESFLIVDEVTILMGTESFLTRMVKAKGTGRLVNMMKSPSVKGDAFAFVNLDPARAFLKELSGQLPPGLPPAISDLATLPEMIVGAEIGVTVDMQFKTQIRLHAIDEEAAEKANEIVKSAVEFGKIMAVGSAATQFDISDPVQAATLEYIKRMSAWYGDAIMPGVDGNTLTLNLQNQEAMGPVLIGMLLPALQQTRTAARRTASMNNARQMALAMHNIAAATGKGFPAQANYDKNGKPLLSWRVHILPYIGEQELYNQFHLDEPWNSPHNRKLISRMPMFYSSPGVGEMNGKTVYLANASKGGVFGKEPRSFDSIPDGLSNTALLLEVSPEMAVEWTRPVDYQWDANNPTRGLGGTFPGGFNVSMADGSVRFVSETIDPEAWKQMLLIDDQSNRR